MSEIGITELHMKNKNSTLDLIKIFQNSNNFFPFLNKLSSSCYTFRNKPVFMRSDENVDT